MLITQREMARNPEVGDSASRPLTQQAEIPVIRKTNSSCLSKTFPVSAQEVPLPGKIRTVGHLIKSQNPATSPPPTLALLASIRPNRWGRCGAQARSGRRSGQGHRRSFRLPGRLRAASARTVTFPSLRLSVGAS